MGLREENKSYQTELHMLFSVFSLQHENNICLDKIIKKNHPI